MSVCSADLGNQVGPTARALRELISGDALAQVPRPVQALILGMTVGTAVWAVARPRPPAVLAFGACAAMWLRANSAFEGAILVTLTPEHGLTVADLLPPALAALILSRWVTRSPGEPPPLAPPAQADRG